jgi:hypothetical protein
MGIPQPQLDPQQLTASDCEADGEPAGTNITRGLHSVGLLVKPIWHCCCVCMLMGDRWRACRQKLAPVPGMLTAYEANMAFLLMVADMPQLAGCRSETDGEPQGTNKAPG